MSSHNFSETSATSATSGTTLSLYPLFLPFLLFSSYLPDDITHFQSIVFPPLVCYSSIASFLARWQHAYTPLLSVSASIYDPVLAPISLHEWSDVISSMPNNKASGPSKISYEMIKHLSNEALDFSLLLANACLSCGDIPADWREAVVYPIPKPHDFDAQLKNTRPITLLETVRNV
ncbi:reverse transcriptase family protein [Rhizophagus irregularis DAOM 181602=DAOM 197198]|nr:reverse transcriptase family protein [Rhizophagus irregularis DAOM 181602=DAOM 197198]